MLYRAAMEVYARGINYLLPHGTWWDPATMRIVPEISWRNPDMGPELPRYNRWAARCETLLRAGRHAADIGVLYPIDDLAARYQVGLLPATHGKDPVPGTRLLRALAAADGRGSPRFHLPASGGHGRALPRRGPRIRARQSQQLGTLPRPDSSRLPHHPRQQPEEGRATSLPQADASSRPPVCRNNPRNSGAMRRCGRMARGDVRPGGKGLFVPEPNETTLLEALDGMGFAWDVRITRATDIPRTMRKATTTAAN